MNEKWIRAAILGSLWASVEIILGSFLHNLRVPLTGTILSFVAVILIISLTKNWNQSGVIIRASLICAIMKSISPSAIIFGPMIGIFLEGALIECSISIFGRNRIGFLVGGILAILSPLIQNISGLLIQYGFNLIEILNKSTIIISKSIGINNFDAIDLIWIFVGINLSMGIIAVVIALKFSEGFYKISSEKEEIIQISDDNSSIFGLKSSVDYSIFMLIINIFLMILLLFIINIFQIAISILFSFVYIIFVYFRYKNILKKFKRRKIWIEFLILIFLSAVLLGGINDLDSLIRGLTAGAQMVLRALIIIIGFGIISFELRNPKIITWLINKGGKQFYSSLDLAFLTLPTMISFLSAQKNIFKEPKQFLFKAYQIVEQLIQKFQTTKNKRKVLIITGPVNSGKSTLLKNVIIELKMKGKKLSGLITENYLENNIKMGFDLVDLSSNEKKVLCRKDNKQSGIFLGGYSFNEDAINYGNHILADLVRNEFDILIIDEIGKLELDGKGWYLDEIFKIIEKPIICVIRENLVAPVCDKYIIFPDFIYYSQKDTYKQIISDLEK